MVKAILPTEENWEVDKFALVLKDGEDKGKMVGFVGTNRWSAEGMEVGYCMNVSYWGRGFASEGFLAFLPLFWSLPGL